MRRLSLLLIGSLLACSLISVTPPPARLEPGNYPVCDDESLMPAADAVWAVVMGLTAVALIAGNEGQGVAVVPGGFAVLFAASGISGARRIERCGEMRQQGEMYISSAPLRVFPPPDAGTRGDGAADASEAPPERAPPPPAALPPPQ